MQTWGHGGMYMYCVHHTIIWLQILRLYDSAGWLNDILTDIHWDSGDHACSTYTQIQYLTIESIYESHRDLYSRCKYSSCYWFIFILITKSQLISLQYLQHRKFRITKSSTHENQSVILLPWIISDGGEGGSERREGAGREQREGGMGLSLSLCSKQELIRCSHPHANHPSSLINNDDM